MSVFEAAESGDRVAALRALRGSLAREIDACESSRDLPALSRQLVMVMRELHELAPPAAEVDEVDEIAQRRAARHAGSTKGQARAKRSS